MTAARDFVHLHLHSEFSLLDGANRIGPLCDRVAELGMGAVALTDHGNMFGALAFQGAAQERGIRPILGCEVYVAPTGRADRRPGIQRRTNHLLLLAKTRAGYRNLCKLTSIGYLEGFYYKPRVDLEALAQHSEGLVCTSACLKGSVPQALLESGEEEAARLAGQCAEIFGRENYFLEIQDHGIPEQAEVNRKIVPLAKRLGLGLVATNDAHYLCREDSTVQEAAICIQTGKTLDDPNRMRFYNDQFYVKDPREMWELFGEVPEALLNTVKIAEMCDATIETGTYHLPTFECPDGLSQGDYLRRLVEEGLTHRYGEVGGDARERAEYELGVIRDMGFEGYFLIVWDFVKYAKERGIPVGPGRGSAAGSIVAFALGITDLCPLRHGLIFERFLNPGRRTMPDIDIDFCVEGRAEVIDYVRRRYGCDQVAQIITFGTMKAKAAVRDVGRIMGVDLREVDRLAKLIPDGVGVNFEKAFANSPELRDAADATEESQRLFEMARALEGTVRHASTHAAGVVIGDRDLTDYLPLYRAAGTDDVATQFTMTEVEEIGLLKVDFLGLKNLTIIENCLRILRAKHGIEIDWDEISLDDPETYALLQRGETYGVFQLESSGMRGLLAQVGPTQFGDIVALLALYRPGPLESGTAESYHRRKNGHERVTHDHPILEPILKETHGVIVYQEQVMQIARDMAGYSLPEADTLRKAMGKKIKSVMDAERAKFVDGSVANGVRRETAGKIWNSIVTFAGYGFNKVHSAAYAVITFRTAYLKAHHPTEYMAAQLTNEISGSNTTEKIAFYMDVCRQMGLSILPPDANESNHDFTVVGEREIRFGLEAIKGVGHGAAQAIVEARTEEGPYTSLQDLCQRADLGRVNAKAIECLIKSGALDSTGHRRSRMMAALPQAVEIGAALARERASGQASLFGEDAAEAMRPTPIEMPDVPEWGDVERLEYEKDLLGTYLTGHPLDRHAALLEGLDLTATTDIPHLEPGAKIDMLGLLRAVRAITTKRGDPMAFVTFEDYRGTTEAVVFKDAYAKHRAELQVDRALWVRGQVQARNGENNLRVDEILPPEKAAETSTRWWTVHVPMAEGVTGDVDGALQRIQAALRAHPGERRVRLRIERADGLVVEMPTSIRVRPDDSLRAEVDALCAEMGAGASAPQPLTTA